MRWYELPGLTKQESILQLYSAVTPVTQRQVAVVPVAKVRYFFWQNLWKLSMNDPKIKVELNLTATPVRPERIGYSVVGR